jgi:AcrR family transcriptional regulator
MTQPNRRPGRPRDAELSDAIERAIVDIVTSGGASELSISGIVERAGTSRPAFYRRHPDLNAAILHVLQHRYPHVGTPDTGTLEGDLLVLQRAEIEMLNDPFFRGVLPHVMLAADDDEESRRYYVDHFVRPRRTQIGEVLAAAARRGEIPDEYDTNAVCDALIGLLLPVTMIPGGDTLGEDAVTRSVRVAMSIAREHAAA